MKSLQTLKEFCDHGVHSGRVSDYKKMKGGGKEDKIESGKI